MTGVVRRGVAAALGAALLASVSGCGLLDRSNKADAAPPKAATTPAAFDSQFTHDGTFQSHVKVRGVPGMDFVFTMYPTKATPRTNEWYPAGKKYFSFTFQAYDLDRRIRSPFASKRRVWLDRVTATSATVTSAGGATQHPYSLNASARRITFDPEPLSNRYGMLVTSPKGAFELRNQAIGDVSADTRGVNLTLTAVVWVETRAGSGHYVRRTVKQTVPIAIFASKQTTAAADIPVDAN